MSWVGKAQYLGELDEEPPRLETCSECGGDCYDVAQVAEKRLCICCVGSEAARAIGRATVEVLETGRPHPALRGLSDVEAELLGVVEDAEHVRRLLRRSLKLWRVVLERSEEAGWARAIVGLLGGSNYVCAHVNEVGDLFGTEAERWCRACGCTQDDCGGCVERTGEPCSWVTDELCSACVSEALEAGMTKEAP